MRHIELKHSKSEREIKMEKNGYEREIKMEKNGQCTLMVFQTPFTMIVSGATLSGKTSWVKTLLKHKESMISPAPKKILFCYKYWQPSYTEMMQSIPEMMFHQGMPNPLDQPEFFDPDIPSLIVFDDLMRTVMNDNTAADLFTEGAHHQNTSVIFIIQNLFFQGKQSRTISVNAHYFVLLKNPRDRSQIETFGRQIYPRKSSVFNQAYEQATLQPHGYLVVDLYPTTPDSCRLRTNIFPNELSGHNELFHVMEPIVNSLKRKEYMEPAEMHAVHESKKKIRALMDRHDLPDDVRAREIGNAQDRYLLFRNRVKSKQPYYRKLENNPRRELPPRLSPPPSPEESLFDKDYFPPELPDLEDVESDDVTWEELPEDEEQEVEPTVSETPLNPSQDSRPAPPQSELTPTVFNFPRTDYDFRPINGRFISFTDDMDKTV